MLDEAERDIGRELTRELARPTALKEFKIAKLQGG